jgi:hypothetical protein
MDGRRFADEGRQSGGSDDAFLYARCFVVAQGEAHYRSVLAHPEQMPKTLEEWCEPLLYVGGTAHERLTGTEGDFDTSVSWETGSNRAQWD